MKDEKHWLVISFFAAGPEITSQRWWVERSHLPILGADAHMLSTFIQTDLVDLHWTLRRHNITASFFLKRWASIIVDGQMLLADILPQLSEMPGKRKKGNGCMVPYVSMHRECINTENVRGPSAADAFKFRALKIKGSTKWHKLQQMLL